MNLRSEIIIEIIKNERTYRFSMPVGATFVECIDTAKETVEAVLDMAKQAEEQAKKSSEGEVPVEVVERD